MGGIRENLNQKPALIIVVALLFMGAAISFAYYSMRTPSAKPVIWTFIDEETGEESVRAATDIPPLLGKSGKPTVVREQFSCLDCPTRKVVFYEKYSDDAKAALQQMIDSKGHIGPEMTNVFMQIEKGHFIRSPQPGSPWVLADSPEAQQIKWKTQGIPGTPPPSPMR